MAVIQRTTFAILWCCHDALGSILQPSTGLRGCALSASGSEQPCSGFSYTTFSFSSSARRTSHFNDPENRADHNWTGCPTSTPPPPPPTYLFGRISSSRTWPTAFVRWGTWSMIATVIRYSGWMYMGWNNEMRWDDVVKEERTWILHYLRQWNNIVSLDDKISWICVATAPWRVNLWSISSSDSDHIRIGSNENQNCIIFNMIGQGTKTVCPVKQSEYTATNGAVGKRRLGPRVFGYGDSRLFRHVVYLNSRV